MTEFEKKELFKLAKAVAKSDKKTPIAFSLTEGKTESFNYNVLNEVLHNELNKLGGTIALYRQNKNTIFELIETVFDDVVPVKVMEQWGNFAEVKQFNQGDRPVFVQKVTTASKRRAKQFITKVGLAGIYEVFKLDGRSYEVPTNAIGGAGQIGFEEMLDGRIEFATIYDIIMEGLNDTIYVEIEKALKAAIDNISFPAANKVTDTAFVESKMDKLLSISDSYGGKSTIYCTFEFAGTMIPSTGWISDSMREQKWNQGYLGNYKGHNVIILPQSYTDETNTTKVIDPSYAWIMPTGSNEKPVKIAFEGQTIVDEYVNKDRSREVQVYKKVGVGAILTPDTCVYRNTSLVV